MISTDYTNRTHDLFIAQGAEHSVNSMTKLTLSYGLSTKIVAGIEKAAQAFMILFLTERGSALDSNMGCSFLQDMKTGRLRTEADIQAAFSAAADQVLYQLQSAWTMELASGAIPAIPNDEYLSKISLLSFNLEKDSFELHVALSTRAGVSHDIILPLPVVIP